MRISDWSSDVCSSDLRAEIGLADHLARLVFVGRGATLIGEHVGRDREEARERDAARDILDMWGEPAIFVNDDHRCAVPRHPGARLGGIDVEPAGLTERSEARRDGTEVGRNYR